MSNYCRECPFDPRMATGDKACPVTTLYRDFLDRRRERFSGNRRMTFQLRNLSRKDDRGLRAIRARADAIREKLARGRYPA